MRTTITLESDVAEALERVRVDRRLTLKQAVNEALRRGLADLAEPPTGEPFSTISVSLGELLVGGIDDVSEALALAEGEDRR